MSSPKPPPAAGKRPPKKFPGLDAIRNRKPSERPTGRPRTREWTEEELAALPPSARRRILVSTVPIFTAAGIVRAGRVTKLTRELVGVIVRNLVSGAPVEVCAGAAGVASNTLREWMARGVATDPETGAHLEPEGSVFRELAESVERARSDWWLSTYARIGSGKTGWQGRAWLAERKDPHALGPPAKRLEHSGPGGGGIRIIPTAVEIPAEIPDDHPAIVAASRQVATRRAELAATREASEKLDPVLRAAFDAAPPATNGSAKPRGFGAVNGAAAVVIAGAVEIPEERDPDG